MAQKARVRGQLSSTRKASAAGYPAGEWRHAAHLHCIAWPTCPQSSTTCTGGPRRTCRRPYAQVQARPANNAGGTAHKVSKRMIRPVKRCALASKGLRAQQQWHKAQHKAERLSVFKRCGVSRHGSCEVGGAGEGCSQQYSMRRRGKMSARRAPLSARTHLHSCAALSMIAGLTHKTALTKQSKVALVQAVRQLQRTCAHRAEVASPLCSISTPLPSDTLVGAGASSECSSRACPIIPPCTSTKKLSAVWGLDSCSCRGGAA